MNAVLKAAQAVSAPAPRVLLRGDAAAPVAPPAEPGRWISDSELASLKRLCMEQGRKQGEEQGHQAAQQAAREQANREAKAIYEHQLRELQQRHAKEQAEKWRGLATTLAGQARAHRERLVAEVTEWTFIAVARLLGEQSPDDVSSVVRRVLDEAKLDGPLTVLLHAHDLGNLEASGATAADGWPAGVSFAASDRVGLGGCLIQSDVQALDARLEVQLALLRETLDVARHERAGKKG